MNEKTIPTKRVIGFDSHPDSFTAAVLRGQTPAEAITEKMFNQIPMAQLQKWAQKHTTPDDLLVLEASGNSFHVVRTLAAIGRKALVLESCQMGKLKEAHANNDKISAVRIGKAYLAGTAKEVWVPDLRTQERRDAFYAHAKAVKRTTQTRNRLRSYLSDHGVRLPQNVRLTKIKEAQEQIQKAHTWSPLQWTILENLLVDLEQANQQRERWRSVIAQEVLDDAHMLSMVRLCGVRETIAFALGAFIGDIKRFAQPRKLVKYVGLNPAFDHSGKGTWQGGIGGHGHKDLRALLIQGAHAILRSGRTPLAQWGKKLLARKGEKNLVVAAVARKLVVSIWYLMMGRWTPLEELDGPLAQKVGKIITQAGPELLRKLGKKRGPFTLEIHERLKTGRVYVLDRKKKFIPKPSPPAEAILAP
jgi:transposase